MLPFSGAASVPAERFLPPAEFQVEWDVFCLQHFACLHFGQL